jgi:hypothetical protein
VFEGVQAQGFEARPGNFLLSVGLSVRLSAKYQRCFRCTNFFEILCYGLLQKSNKSKSG